MALGMIGVELLKVQTACSCALNPNASIGVGVAIVVTNVEERAGTSRDKKLNARPLRDEKVLKSTSKMNSIVQLAVVIRQNRLRSEGHFSNATNILEKREVLSIGSRSVISTI